MVQEFTGADFVRALATDTLKDHIICEGMAKQNENDSNSVLFAEGLNCTNWIPIPVKMIEKVEFIRNVPCKDHEHPYVHIHMKVPDNPEAEVFSRLLTTRSTRHPLTVGAESTLLATWWPEQAVPIGLSFAESLPYLQSSGSTGPGQSTCLCCRVDCITIAIATGSGGITFVKRCFPTDCRPCTCPK